jgi:hypothetical protein
MAWPSLGFGRLETADAFAWGLAPGKPETREGQAGKPETGEGGVGKAGCGGRV